MFLFAATLAAAALVSGPSKAEAKRCLEPACFASPGCCYDWQCDSWCGGTGLGWCQGSNGIYGGCCACVG
jgi:hypothetical protein